MTEICTRCRDSFYPVFSMILCPPCHEDEIDRKLRNVPETDASAPVDDIDREFYLDTIGG